VKAICDKRALYEALDKARLCLSKSLPILSCFRVDAHRGSLCFTATNLEQTIETWCEAEVEGYDKSFCVLGEKFSSIVKELPEDKVELSLGKTFHIKSGKARFSLATMDVEEFPEVNIPEFKDKIDLVNFVYCLEKVSFCTAQKYGREVLRSVLVGKHIVATDGKRLAYMPCIWEEKDIIVPSDFVALLRKVVEDLEGEYAVDESRFAVRLNDAVVMTQLVDGRFPDWKGVLPKKDELDKVYVINRETFIKAIKRVSLMSEKETRIVRLKFGGGKLTLCSFSADGQGEEEIEVEGDAELEIGFNAVYLLEGLRACEGEEVKMICKDSVSPTLFEQKDNAEWGYILMPVQLREES